MAGGQRALSDRFWGSLEPRGRAINAIVTNSCEEHHPWRPALQRTLHYSARERDLPIFSAYFYYCPLPMLAELFVDYTLGSRS